MSEITAAIISTEPKRTCIGCREVKEKKGLIRFVLSDGGELTYDPHKVLAGRGAYLCRDKGCFTDACRKGGFARSFRRKIRVYTPEEIWKIANV